MVADSFLAHSDILVSKTLWDKLLIGSAGKRKNSKVLEELTLLRSNQNAEVLCTHLHCCFAIFCERTKNPFTRRRSASLASLLRPIVPLSQEVTNKGPGSEVAQKNRTMQGKEVSRRPEFSADCNSGCTSDLKSLQQHAAKASLVSLQMVTTDAFHADSVLREEELLLIKGILLRQKRARRQGCSVGEAKDVVV